MGLAVIDADLGRAKVAAILRGFSEANEVAAGKLPLLMTKLFNIALDPKALPHHVQKAANSIATMLKTIHVCAAAHGIAANAGSASSDVAAAEEAIRRVLDDSSSSPETRKAIIHKIRDELKTSIPSIPMEKTA